MKDSARYAKVVQWSEEDGCYVGTAPALIYGGCHGDDEQAVFAQLCQIVEEAVELYKQDNKPLPPATAAQFIGPAKPMARTVPERGKSRAKRRDNGTLNDAFPWKRRRAMT